MQFLATLSILLIILIFGATGLILLSKKDQKSAPFPFIIAIGIVTLSAIGAISSVLPDSYLFLVLLLSAFVASAYVAISSRHSELRRNTYATIKQNTLPIFAWIVISLITTVLSFLPVNKPVELYDGPYVFKYWTLPVQIQAFAMNFPPDNAIPAVVTEFLANEIDFQDERPIMPGQEFANRPILASFAALPLRLALGSEDTNSSPLERFEYVSTSWPDTLSIVSDREFRIFLSTAIPLNASLAAIATWLIMQLSIFKGGSNRKLLYSAVTGFVILNPFLIFHTLFTWPKNLAAMFIISSLIAVKSDLTRRYLISGMLMALAYWSHPMTMPFIFIAAIYIFFDGISREALRENISNASKFMLTTVSVILPWILWTNVYMKMPFDLIAQNATPTGSLIEQIGVRMNNIFILSAPTHLNIQPMEIGAFLSSYMTNLWNPLGLLMIVVFPALYFFRNHEMNYLVIVPTISALLITLLHAFPAATIVHGWQAAWPGLLLACFSLLSSRTNLLWKFVVIQLVVNSLIIGLWVLKFTEIDVPV